MATAPRFVSPVASSRVPEILVLREFPPPHIESAWRECLNHIEYSAHYDSPDFFLEPYWKPGAPFAVLALENKRVIGVLTGLNQGKHVTCGLESRPQICISSRASAPDVTDALAKGLLDVSKSAELVTVFAWSGTQLPGFECMGFRKREYAGDVVLDLKLGKDALFRGMHENRKRNIRLAIKNGVEVSEEVSSEDLAAYWTVYSAWKHTPRKEIHHNRSFQQLEATHNMPQNHRRFLAKYQGKTIAATGLRFYQGGLVEYANNCSLDEYLYLRPNDLVLWRTIEWACDQGFSRYSLGASHPFLRKSGGTVVPINRYRLDRSFLRRHDLRERIADMSRKVIAEFLRPRMRLLVRKGGKGESP